MASKCAILYQLRDDILEDLSTSGKTHEGVAQAAREACNSGRIRSERRNKLVKFDWAYNFVRHLTQAKADAFRRDFRCELGIHDSQFWTDVRHQVGRRI